MNAPIDSAALSQRGARDWSHSQTMRDRLTGLPTAPIHTTRPASDLISDAVGQLGDLVGNEFALARAELSERAGQIGRAAAMIAAGAIVLIPGLVVGLFAIAALLIDRGFSNPAAYGLTGGGTIILAAILMAVGKSRLSADALKPSVTLEQIEKDKAAAKEMVG